jgi:hypothetical protein
LFSKLSFAIIPKQELGNEGKDSLGKQKTAGSAALLLHIKFL